MVGFATMRGVASSGRARDWVDRYERAWRTPGTDGLAALFTDDAAYVPEPFAEPIRGLAAIAEFWEDGRAGADEVFTLTAEVVAEEADRGVVRLEVVYGDPPTHRYRDLWVITFDDDGRAREFEEWPFFPGRGRLAPGD
jgi:ketosteroid isomerase-like protein